MVIDTGMKECMVSENLEGLPFSVVQQNDLLFICEDTDDQLISLNSLLGWRTSTSLAFLVDGHGIALAVAVISRGWLTIQWELDVLVDALATPNAKDILDFLHASYTTITN